MLALCVRVQLQSIEQERTKTGVLRAIRTLALHHLDAVIAKLFKFDLPMSPLIVDVWHTLAADTTLAPRILDEILDTLDSRCCALPFPPPPPLSLPPSRPLPLLFVFPLFCSGLFACHMKARKDAHVVLFSSVSFPFFPLPCPLFFFFFFFFFSLLSTCSFSLFVFAAFRTKDGMASTRTRSRP